MSRATRSPGWSGRGHMCPWSSVRGVQREKVECRLGRRRIPPWRNCMRTSLARPQGEAAQPQICPVSTSPAPVKANDGSKLFSPHVCTHSRREVVRLGLATRWVQSGASGKSRGSRGVKPHRRRVAAAGSPKSAFLRAGAGQPAIVGRCRKLVAGQERTREADMHRLKHASVNSAPCAGGSRR